VTAGPERPRIGLDWRHNSHTLTRRAKCRHCGNPTWTRDDDGKPSHKTCAEDALNRAAKTKET